MAKDIERLTDTLDIANAHLSEFRKLTEKRVPPGLPATSVEVQALAKETNVILTDASARLKVIGLDAEAANIEALNTKLQGVFAVRRSRKQCSWFHSWSEWVNTGTFMQQKLQNGTWVKVVYVKLMRECLDCGHIGYRDEPIMNG